MWVSRAWVGVGAAALVLCAAAATWAVTQESDATPADPRESDEALFISQVNESLDGGYRGPRSRQNPPAVLIAEGDRACAWPANQPVP